MANDLNLCQFIGRLGRDPETRYTAAGDAVCNFSIAVGWKTKDKEGAEWVRCTAFKQLAEICEKYLTKGKQVYVSGRWRTRQYEKEGITHYATELAVDQMQMLGGRDESDAPAPAPQRQAARPSPAPAPEPERRQARRSNSGFVDVDSDSIPF